MYKSKIALVIKSKPSDMASLTRVQIKEIVREALKKVADFNGDIENYSFNNFHEYHKKIIILNLKYQINYYPVKDDDGNIINGRYYDIPLSISKIDSEDGWDKNISKCIDDIEENQMLDWSENNLNL